MNPSILVLLLVLCTVLPADGQDFKKFKAKHVNGAMDPSMCTEEMKKINESPLKAKKHICKPRNTFILDTIDKIKEVCNLPPYKGDFRESGKTFTIVDCITKSTKKPCVYTGEKKNNAAIYIACVKKLPVHYGKPKKQ
ncbi:ribonuclease-like [Astyanax mexicanus]|uniref:Ribonuclease-like n=1 Tax=Astyanax mexicanus TaxID=7994 RepID=A0A8T2MDH2_ASTMX|nr:ribonuclease-like [Astyanax mexicanus]